MGGSQHLTKRLLFLLLVFVLNVAPGVKVFAIKTQIDNGPNIDLIIGIVHFVIAIITFLFFSIMPLGGLFGSYLTKNSRRYVASQTFTASYPRLRGNDMAMSFGLWVVVFGLKFGESYVYLTLSFKDAIRYLHIMNVDSCQGDQELLQNSLCRWFRWSSLR